MPNRNVHSVVGVIAGSSYSLYLSKGQERESRMWEAIGAGIGGHLGSRLPDIINPATHTGHRAFAHSLVAGTVSAASANEIASSWTKTFREIADTLKDKSQCEGNSQFERDMYLILEVFTRIAAGIGPGLVAGYVSHLALDATTRRSLPVA